MESVDTNTDMSNNANKRKSNEVWEEDDITKRPYRRRRARSVPRNTGSRSAQKRVALRRLYGRYCLRDGLRFNVEDDNYLTENDENDDPLYIEDRVLHDAIPAYMDPEQLGFLLCAQETLCFMRQSGMSVNHSVYASLRNRFLQALYDLGIA